MLFRKNFCNIIHRSNFGQAGVLHLNLHKNKFNTQFHTIWEDYSEVQIEAKNKDKITSEENGKNFIINEQEHSNKDTTFLKAFIPEYSSIIGKLNGNFDFTQANEVSQQIYGYLFQIRDVRLENKQGDIKFNKAKCEMCNIVNQNGSIEFKKSLESYQIYLETVKGNIHSKRFALSGQGDIIIEDGNLDLKAIYVDQTQVAGNYVDYKGNIQKNLQNLNNDSLKQNFIHCQILQNKKRLQVKQNNGNINLDTIQGNFSIFTRGQGKINIGQINASQFYIHVQNKLSKMHLQSIKKDSFIFQQTYEPKQTMNLTVEPEFIGKIYCFTQKKYIKEGNEQDPCLFIKGDINLEFKKNENDIFSRLRALHGKN